MQLRFPVLKQIPTKVNKDRLIKEIIVNLEFVASEPQLSDFVIDFLSLSCKKVVNVHPFVEEVKAASTHQLFPNHLAPRSPLTAQ